MAKLTKEEIIDMIKGEDIFSLAEIIHKSLGNVSVLNEALYEAVMNILISKDDFLQLMYRMEEAYSIHMYEMC